MVQANDHPKHQNLPIFLNESLLQISTGAPTLCLFSARNFGKDMFTIGPEERFVQVVDDISGSKATRCYIRCQKLAAQQGLYRLYPP